MNRKFWIVAGLIIVAASVAGGFRTRATRHRTPSVSSNAAISAAEKFEADRIENDYREAISTVEENYAGEIDYEKATQDRKSTRLNSSHDQISYAVFCLKKKKN